MLYHETKTRHIVSHAQTEDFESSDLIAVHRLNLLAEYPIPQIMRIEYLRQSQDLYTIGENIFQASRMVSMLVRDNTAENLL